MIEVLATPPKFEESTSHALGPVTLPPREHSRVHAPAINALIPFRVRFSTGSVKPKALPEFAYIVSHITFDAIYYEAVVNAHNLAGAIAEVKRYWTDAITEVAVGYNKTLPDQRQIQVEQFGAYLQNNKESTTLGYLFGWMLFWRQPKT